MKTIKKITALLLGVLVVAFYACEPKEIEDVFGKPVLDRDFTVTVDGNDVQLKCTNTAMTSVLWELSTGEQSTEKQATIYIPTAGDYTVTLSVSNGGDYISADPVNFTIASTDEAYYNSGIWKALTGGAGVTKTWVLDILEHVTITIDDAGSSTSTSVFKSTYFHNPIDFYGEAGVGDDNGKSWGPWGGTSIYDWGGTPEEGEITFDATSGNVKSTIEGEVKTGKYTFSIFDRPEDFINPPLEEQTLWENFLDGKYYYLGSLSEQMGDIKFASGLRFPMDVGRITNDGNETNSSQFLTSDLENITILHCSDSALIVRVKRTYEGDNPSACWLLYNYIVKEYDYPTPPNYTHPVKAITATDLVGTWKLAGIPANWIGWASANELNDWADGAAMNATFDSWGQSNTTEKLAASQQVNLTFGSDGSCTITDVKFNTTTLQEESTGYTTTYSVNNGYITFGSDVNITGYTDMITLSGTHVYAMDVTGSSTGLWIGQNNGDKPESSAVHLIKQ